MARARKPKLTDAERHKRFVDMARKVEASEDPKDFDRAFENIISHRPSKDDPSPATAKRRKRA